jgi:hypothetical protein
LRQYKEEILEAHRSGLSVHRIAQIFRERGVDISCPIWCAPSGLLRRDPPPIVLYCLGGDGALAMDYFAGALQGSGNNKVVYHENHDEAGNEDHTRRTMVEAVNGASLIGTTRKFKIISQITLLWWSTEMAVRFRRFRFDGRRDAGVR